MIPKFAFKRGILYLFGAPFTFQEAVDKILKPLLCKGALLSLDDIIIIAVTFEQQLKFVRKVYTPLRTAGSIVKVSKIKCLKREIKYLRIKIIPNEIKSDSKKSRDTSLKITSIS